MSLGVQLSWLVLFVCNIAVLIMINIMIITTIMISCPLAVTWPGWFQLCVLNIAYIEENIA